MWFICDYEWKYDKCLVNDAKVEDALVFRFHEKLCVYVIYMWLQMKVWQVRGDAPVFRFQHWEMQPQDGLRIILFSCFLVILIYGLFYGLSCYLVFLSLVILIYGLFYGLSCYPHLSFSGLSIGRCSLRMDYGLSCYLPHLSFFIPLVSYLHYLHLSFLLYDKHIFAIFLRPIGELQVMDCEGSCDWKIFPKRALSAFEGSVVSLSPLQLSFLYQIRTNSFDATHE